MPFDLRVDFIKITSETALVPITIQMKVKDMTFLQKEGIQRASVNIFGRITTLTGRVAATFEDTVASTSRTICWKRPCRPRSFTGRPCH